MSVYCAVTGYGEQGPLKALRLRGGLLRRGVDCGGRGLGAVRIASADRSSDTPTSWPTPLRSRSGEPREVGRDMRSGGITGIHPTRDGYLYISANTPHFWHALCEKTGLHDLLATDRYDSVRKRAQHQAEIVPRLHAALAERSAQQWEQVFGEEVPCAAARTVEDMFDFPQVLAEGMVHTYHHPVVGSYRGFTRAVTFGRTPGPAPFASPALGQHDEAVRAEAQRSLF